MNIGDVAERSGLPAKTIRYYEEIGLLTPERSGNGYRHFSDGDLQKLAFVGRARSLGFGIEACRDLLRLYEDRGRASSDVKSVAAGHLAEVDRKLAELAAMRATLAGLIDRCHGDAQPDCAILAGLAGGPAAPDRR